MLRLHYSTQTNADCNLRHALQTSAGAGETTGAALVALAQGTEELGDTDKVTIFAPEDAAWPATLPAGEELLIVRPPCNINSGSHCMHLLLLCRL